MKIYLNKTVIEEPLNWENLRLLKKRDAGWGGIVENTSGVLEEDGLLFRDPLAVGIIRTRWEQERHAARIILGIEEGGSTWESALDWNTMQIREEGISIGLVDRSARKVITAAQTVSEWEATETYTLHGLPLGGAITATVPAEKTLVSGHTPSHAVPVKATSKEGLGLYLEADGTLPFWRNNTDYDLTIRLEMLLPVSVVIRNSNSYVVYVRIYDQADKVVDQLLVGTYTAGAVQWLFASDLLISKGYAVGIWVQCNQEVYTFTYSTENGISLTEVPDEVTAVRCLRLDTLLNRWATANGLTLTGGSLLSDLYLTSGALLRGVDRMMKVNMDLLFADIRKLLNLKIGHSDLTLTVKAAATGKQYIRHVEKMALDPLPLMYSSIVYGFQTWQSKTVQGNGEPNGRFTYGTGFDTLSELDLSLSYLVGSQYLIEKLRRMRYSQVGEKEDADFDDRLFLLTSHDLVSVQQQAWASDLYYNYPLRLLSQDGQTSGSTLSSFQSRYTPYVASIETQLSLSDYHAIGDQIEWTSDGTSYHMEVDEATYSIEDGVAVVTGKLLQP
ncbi:hypothetical protein [Telluribacter humicola]|uniref:hypothetical protein n=1 Tax=Telluribacter humicola TaxID=1720261 RepID=UPI001A978E32|nr:hypothetical protein [Telluribacter humicola]